MEHVFQFYLKEGVSLIHQFGDLEHRVIQYALLSTNGNKSHAAKLLGLGRKTFINKVKKHQLFVHGGPGGKQILVIPPKHVV